MKRFAIRRIIFSFCLLIVTALQAELVILKKTAEGLAALTHDESLRYGPVISQIILKYQWPMCIASDLTKEEKDELLTPGIPNAEEIFIQKKLQQAIPELDIQVIFIPTVLYELFCIYLFLQLNVDDWETKWDSSSKSVFEKVSIILISEFAKQEKWSRVRDLSQGLVNIFTVNVKASEAYVVFDIYNRLFFDTKAQITFESEKSIPLISKDQVNVYMYINNKILDFLKDTFFALALKLPVYIKAFINDTLDEMCDLLLNLKFNDSLNDILKTNERIFIFPKDYATFKNHIKILKTIADLEYQARNNNKGLLLRGSSLLKPKQSKHYIHTVWNEDIELIMGSILDTDDMKDLYSVSFGQSLFAGFFFDGSQAAGACAYSYLISNSGYALLVDKKEYMKSRHNGLFFITPLSTLASLFGSGEFFHARTTLALHKEQRDQLKQQKTVTSMGLTKYLPYNSILISSRNPIVHAELFSEFIAKNGVILNLEEKEAEKILKDQKKLADVYAKIQNVESVWKKWNHLLDIKHLEKYRESVYPNQHPFAARTAREYGL